MPQASPDPRVIRAVDMDDLAVQRGERILFSKLSARIVAGEAVALTGANGAGKTTLLRVVAGLTAPLAGTVRFEGVRGDLPNDDARREACHLVGHQDGLKGARAAGAELEFQVLWTGGDRASAEHAAARMGLTRLLNLPVRVLSAGQRRRLALARLIASPRALWLLDEPLSPLDAESRRLFGQIMGEHLARGGLILAAVHDPLPIPARQIRVGA
jgi:heme exporter protein A